jgi:outer membrane protein OmpA-like peptidoglycan-associated protein
MPSRTGKCTNYTKCTIAYRNQPIPVSGDFVCPECGQPLHEIGQAKKPAPKLVPIIAGGAALLIALIIIFSIARRPSKPLKQPTVIVTPETAPATPEQAPPSTVPLPEPATAPIAGTPTTPLPVTPSPAPLPPPEPAPPDTSVAEVAQPVVLEQNVNVDPKSAENQEIKREVLKRVERMPKLSDSEKDKLYAHVERARGMGKVITIPFASSQTTLSAQNIDQLKAATQSPQIVKMVSDPEVVFVILGFADKQGNPAANLKISTNRAESAMQALRDKCGFLNVMHPVGMGGSELFDTGDRARNRVVEVWAVLP